MSLNFVSEETEAMGKEVSTEGNFRGLTWIWKKILNDNCKHYVWLG